MESGVERRGDGRLVLRDGTVRLLLGLLSLLAVAALVVAVLAAASGATETAVGSALACLGAVLTGYALRRSSGKTD